MSTALPQVFECKKLKAKLTLAACEANRKKPLINSGANCDPYSRVPKALCPRSCEDCRDWMTWTQDGGVEIDLSPDEEKSVPSEIMINEQEVLKVPFEAIESEEMAVESKEVSIMSNLKQEHSNELKAELVKLYENGETVSSLSKKYNISPSNIYAWIKQAGVATHKSQNKQMSEIPVKIAASSINSKEHQLPSNDNNALLVFENERLVKENALLRKVIDVLLELRA